MSKSDRDAVRDVLHNPKYTGYMVWNRRATKSGGHVNPPSAWVRSDEPTHEPLVDRATFEAAAGVSRTTRGSRAEAGLNDAHRDTKRGYLLRSYVRCGVCDQRMFGKTRHGRAYYNCYPAHNNADRLDRFARGERRFLDNDGRAFKRHLANLAQMTHAASAGAALDRVSRIYDEVWIDEVQDLNGYDLEVLSLLMASSLDLYMVGDIRQAILNTNERDPKHSQYKGVNIKRWFDLQESRNRLVVSHAATTWRCNQTIATFADPIFGPEWKFEPTDSRNQDTVAHSGIFAVSTADAEAYSQAHAPLCLRHNKASYKEIDLPFVNIGLAKGMGADHVLVAPTGKMAEFVRASKQLGESAACSLYVAVTRARHSVAFLSDKPDELGLAVWRRSQ